MIRHAETAASAFSTPALDEWRSRGDTRAYDDLWRAACWEASALDRRRAGNFDGAKSDLERSGEIMGVTPTGKRSRPSLPKNGSERHVTTKPERPLDQRAAAAALRRTRYVA